MKRCLYILLCFCVQCANLPSRQDGAMGEFANISDMRDTVNVWEPMTPYAKKKVPEVNFSDKSLYTLFNSMNEYVEEKGKKNFYFECFFSMRGGEESIDCLAMQGDYSECLTAGVVTHARGIVRYLGHIIVVGSRDEKLVNKYIAKAPSGKEFPLASVGRDGSNMITGWVWHPVETDSQKIYQLEICWSNE